MSKFHIGSMFCASALAICGALAGCGGGDGFFATFTSEVVQRESCRLVGESATESCTRDEVTLELRVDLVEDDQGRAQLVGIPLDGDPGRVVVGTKASDGGWIFISERTQTNDASGCVLQDRLELYLRLEDNVSADDVADDACAPLVGREIRFTHTNAACDEVNDPPQDIQRVLRRRWQRSARCDLANEDQT